MKTKMRLKLISVVAFLTSAEDYFLARLTVRDTEIELIKSQMCSHYDLIEEKEKQYRKNIKLYANVDKN